MWLAPGVDYRNGRQTIVLCGLRVFVPFVFETPQPDGVPGLVWYQYTGRAGEMEREVKADIG